MSTKRRDNKNRILQTGESQRKDGRYMYKYIDCAGNTKYLYSWRLVRTDPIPKGCKDTVPLRDKIKVAQRDKEDGIISSGYDITVLELAEKYVAQKAGVKQNTKRAYSFALGILRKEPFGSRRIDKVKYSDAKGWLIKLQEEGLGYSSINLVRNVVKPAFEMAVNDDLLRKNPFSFPLMSVVMNDSVPREAISEQQEEQFLTFLREDSYYNKYYDPVYILFHTGLRISEFSGLTISDLDMNQGIIKVDHQLQRSRGGKYFITDTKTDCGTRIIPMTGEVKECFRRILETRPKPEKEPVVDGKMGFLFLDKNGMPAAGGHWNSRFHEMCGRYNELHEKQIPMITPHICRHTFCSNMARAGMNPKTLQKIMGHSNIGITLNVYTHIGFEDVKKEMLSVCNGL